MTTHLDPERARFGRYFVTLARQWRRAVEGALAGAGLTDATWSPLIQLAEGGDGISQTELAHRLGLDGSSLVRLIDLLEARGFVARELDAQDRRAKRLVLCPAGREEVARVRAALDRRAQSGAEPVSGLNRGLAKSIGEGSTTAGGAALSAQARQSMSRSIAAPAAVRS